MIRTLDAGRLLPLGTRFSPQLQERVTMHACRSLLVPVVVLAGTLSPATAQLFTFRTDTPLPFTEAGTGYCSHLATMPAGPIVGQTRLSAVMLGCGFDTSVSTRSELLLTPQPTGFTVHAEVRLNRGQYSTVPGIVGGAIQMELHGPARGILTVNGTSHLEAQSFPAQVFTPIWVDLWADGIPEFVGIEPYNNIVHGSVPIDVKGNLPIRVEIRSEARGLTWAEDGAWHTLDLSLSFAPSDMAMFTAEGPGCGASPSPSLTGTCSRVPGGHHIELTVDHAIPDGYVALMFSSHTTYSPIGLPPGCTFLVDPGSWIFLPADGLGRCSVAADLPSPLIRASLFIQAIPFDFTPRAWSSNRLRLDLWP